MLAPILRTVDSRLRFRPVHAGHSHMHDANTTSACTGSWSTPMLWHYHGARTIHKTALAKATSTAVELAHCADAELFPGLFILVFMRILDDQVIVEFRKL